MSLSKNISRCQQCLVVHSSRKLTSGASNTITDKMQAKTVVIRQLKLINQLKVYLSKFGDKTFENAVNKEVAHFLQKIQPKVYGSELVRYFRSSEDEKQDKEPASSKEISVDVVAPQGYRNLPSILSDLIGYGVKPEEKAKEVMPKWKTSKPAISKESIASRTSQLLISLTQAEQPYSQLFKVETLIEHLKKFPDAKHIAVKEGAIRMLLRLRSQTSNETVLGALNEAFALLGCSDPVPRQGIRILSIDGGGVRGILVVEMLRKLEELTGQRVNEMFDLICGVSTGAIIATLVGLKQKTLDEVYEIYRGLSTQIFTQSTLKGTSNLVWTHSYYDTALWEKLLKEQWSDKMLMETTRTPNCPKYCAISAVVNQSRLNAYVFRNYSLPCRVQSQYLGGHDHKVWESVRASAAAPTYFEEFKLGNMLHQDGGILVNNPTAVAIHEAKLLWPNAPIQCVVSFGTGRTIPNPIDQQSIDLKQAPNSSWKNKFFAILDSATDTEGVHTMLSDLLPGNTYYRFNPYLTEKVEMSEINPNKLEQLRRDAVMYLRRNEDKFHDAATSLLLKKSVTQKLVDWMTLQKDMFT